MQTKLTQFGTTPAYYLLVGLYLLWTCLVTVIGLGKLPGGRFLFTNRQSSMLPLISPHSLTLVIPQASYDVGDIISYYQEEEGQELIITHRIYQIGGNVYVTKGDYNEAVDSEIVRPRLVIGKVRLVIPYLGALFNFVKTIPGNFLLILLPAGIIVFIELSRYRS